MNKNQSRLKQKPGQEAAHACAANGIYRDPGSLCQVILQADLRTCKDPAPWSHSVPCTANVHGSSASERIERREAISELSSGAQSCLLVESGSRSYLSRGEGLRPS